MTSDASPSAPEMIVRRLRDALGRRIAAASIPLSMAGGVALALAAIPLLPRLKPLFPVPGNGIGLMTAMGYPKGWDYAVVLLLFAVAAAGSLVVAALIPWRGRSRGSDLQSASLVDADAQRPLIDRRPLLVIAIALVVAVAMFPPRDEPHAFLDPYHEGESLSAASVLLDGGRPFRDVFFMHGLATDGGLDILVMGSPPDPARAKKAKAILSAITLALLVPIAAELTSSAIAVIGAVLASICAIAAGQLTSFPYFRLLPLLLMIWLVIRFVRRGRPATLVLAIAIGASGLLWSVDIGLFAIGGFWSWMVARAFLPRRIDGERSAAVGWKAFITLAAVTALTPLILTLLVRGDFGFLVRDTFRRLPECFDAIYSLPAPPLPEIAQLTSLRSLIPWLTTPSGRYYVPVVVYGLMVAGAFILAARGERARGDVLLFFALTALLHFRVAAGRGSWSHIRFPLPLFGLAVVLFAIEPFYRSLRHRSGWRVLPSRVATVLLVTAALIHLEVIANAKYFWKYWSTYDERLQPAPGLVTYPILRMNHVYTYAQDAEDVRALYLFSQSMPPGSIFDFSGEKWVYWLLDRKPATRVHDVPYLANPKLGGEALRQLEKNRPVFVVVKGLEEVAKIDGIGYEQRTPWLLAWIDRNYPRRVQVGRYEIGLPEYR